eukprot:CAMPEP_0119046274 /NCGR_PEP_ID=MMETSP1177-20130426/45527_1 /TAXON_ID=2985 /ORGANISM="Ochromonas sp, Strain CCMP1899" /LENGTH=938 /DNA_ID=CAMNT_0007019197 /DNA_START=345 /DNA_END=3160 /DNA_ORIENTATION=+
MSSNMMENYNHFNANSSSNNRLQEEFNFQLNSSCMAADQKFSTTGKIICRYGRGCTHMHDSSHRERFWHPTLSALTGEQLRTHYICNECGAATSSLDELQLHLQRKTAWSNKSLIGCRISCLVDFKEWHEGHVTQYHRSGKHYVEFRAISERRWLNMKKIAFYIVERPIYSSNTFGEYKEDEIFENSGLAPIEDKWIYCDKVSLNYAFAQSVLFKVYGSTVQETGHKTKGHVCLTDIDKDNAKINKGSLLYGELLPRGANKAFGEQYLAAGRSDVLFDLGMGAGKVAVQAFVQFRNLKYVYGVELSLGRYILAVDAVLRMVQLLGTELFTVVIIPGLSIKVTEKVTRGDSTDELDDDADLGISSLGNVAYGLGNASKGMINDSVEETKCADYIPKVVSSEEMKNLNSVEKSAEKKMKGLKNKKKIKGRVLHLECGNMFDVKNIHMADIVMLETDIPADLQTDLYKLLGSMKEDSRTLTYLDLKKTWSKNLFFPFKQLENNKNLSDRFPTSWSVQRGHHFYVWAKSNHEFEISTSYPRSTGTKPNGNIISGDVSIANGPSLSNGVSAAQIAKEKIKRRVDTVNSDVVGSSGVELDDRKLGKDETRANRCLPFSISQGLRSIFSNESVDIPSKSKMSRGNVTSSLEGERNCDENRIISSLQLISKRNPSPRSSEASDGQMQKIVPLNVEVVEEVLSRGDTSLRESDASFSLKSSHKDYNDMTTPNTKGTGVLQIQELSEHQHNSIDAAGEKNVRRCSLNTKNPVVLWMNSESASSKEILSMKIEDLESKPNYSQGVYGEGGMCVDEAQKDESWYTLGYAIERMNFNLRVATDGSLIRNHANSDTCSGSEDELNRSGEECFDNINMEEEEGGMFLDHSLSQTLSHGGSPWTNNISSNKNEDDDESFQVNPKSNAIYSQESYMDTSLEFLEIGEKVDSGVAK